MTPSDLAELARAVAKLQDLRRDLDREYEAPTIAEEYSRRRACIRRLDDALDILEPIEQRARAPDIPRT